MQRLRMFIVAYSLLLITLSASAGTVNRPGSEDVKSRVKEISRVIKLQPGNVGAYAERASLKLVAGDAYGAIKDYSIALVLAPKNASYLVGRGNAFLEVSAFKEAIQDFESVLANDTSTEALYGRAVAKYHLDDYFGSIRDLDDVIAVAPQHSRAMYNRAVVRIELNQMEQALADLNGFLSYYPGHKDASYALNLVTSHLNKLSGKR